MKRKKKKIRLEHVFCICVVVLVIGIAIAQLWNNDADELIKETDLLIQRYGG